MRKPWRLFFGLTLLVATFVISRTLSSTITLGLEQVEFGQGVLLVTNCDSTVYAQAVPRSINGTYYLDGIEFSGIDTTSCDNRDFVIKAFNNDDLLSFAQGISQIQIRLYGGFFHSLTNGVRIVSGDAKGWFLAEVDTASTLLSADLKKITLESKRAGSYESCTEAPVEGDSGELTFTFSTVGACIFTSPHTQSAANLVVVAGGGGGGGGSAVPSSHSGNGGGGGGGGGGEVRTNTVNLVANGKYLVIVGDGGAGGLGGTSNNTSAGNSGQSGYSSIGFGLRARPGRGGLGADSNINAEGFVTEGCTGSSTVGTGGIGGASGNNNLGGNKSCSLSGGGGGGGSSTAGSTPTSSSGAVGGSGISSIGGTYGSGGSGGNGGDSANPSNATGSTQKGNGGEGGTGAKNGVAGTGGSGAPGVVILRYTP